MRAPPTRRGILAASLALPMLAIAPVGATITFTVNSHDDAPIGGEPGVCQTARAPPYNTTCTLRAAMQAAATVSRQAGEEVVIRLPGSPGGVPAYTLTIPPVMSDYSGANGSLYVNSGGPTTIQGDGAATTVIDANHLASAFVIGYQTALFKLSGVTVRNGNASGSGGGINNGLFGSGGTVIVERSDIQYCDAGSAGGGIYVNSGTLTVTDSTIEHCLAGYGAAIGIDSTFFVSDAGISRSRLYTNTASQSGGGVWSSSGNVRIDHSAVAANSASNGYGGGVGAEGGGSLAIWDSTIGSNSSFDRGGGIYAAVSTTLQNVTIAINFVEDMHATGGGLYVYSGSSVQMSNSILHSNSNDYTGGTTNCVGPVTSNNYNIISDATGCSVTGTYSTSDPLIEALADNGGDTETFFLPSNSPAIGTGRPQVLGGCTDPYAAPLTDDQRGVKRPIGTNCDLGAVEVEPPGDVNGDGNVDVADVFYLINFLFASGPVPPGRANVNGSGGIDVSDAFFLINYLFAGGPPPMP
jgi:hypothetical protein